MAVSFITTIGTTDYGFDWVNKVIEIEAAVLDIGAADLKDAIHDAQDGTEGMPFDQIANFGNPVVLTPTTSTFLNVILLSTWKILSLSVTGTFTVGEGNVVSLADGIDIFAANVLVTLVNNTSAAGVLVESGISGLTGAESAALLSTEIKTEELWTLLGLKIGDKITITPAGIDSDSGDIDIDFTGDGISSTEMERQ